MQVGASSMLWSLLASFCGTMCHSTALIDAFCSC